MVARPDIAELAWSIFDEWFFWWNSTDQISEQRNYATGTATATPNGIPKTFTNLKMIRGCSFNVQS
jgi:hypothetical protein